MTAWAAVSPRSSCADMTTIEAEGVVRSDESPADADLVAHVLRGNRESFSTLVRRHQERLYRYARGMGIDHDTALDLVQDSFVRAYVKLGRCRDRVRFGVWLFRILRNRCLDHLKSAQRRGVSLDALPASVAVPADGEVRTVLDNAFAALPVPLREAFLLKHRDGWSYEEMAEITGASVSAVKMRVHRARDSLRALLEESYR